MIAGPGGAIRKVSKESIHVRMFVVVSVILELFEIWLRAQFQPSSYTLLVLFVVSCCCVCQARNGRLRNAWLYVAVAPLAVQARSFAAGSAVVELAVARLDMMCV